MNITVIDNYDSFVYNLVDYILRNPGVKAKVYRNDKISVPEILDENPDAIMISPGPGRPQKAGICIELIKKTPSSVPLLGVCLGHQAIGAACGGRIKKAGSIYHGKTSAVTHDGKGMFRGLKNPLRATRYHSLVVEKSSLPEEFEITAESDDGEIMGIRHKKRKLYGLQFHPESILTEGGLKIMRNFVRIAGEKNKGSSTNCR